MAVRKNQEKREAHKREYEDINRRLGLELPAIGEKWTPITAAQTEEPDPKNILTPWLFDQLPLSARTLDGVRRCRFTHLTKIQADAIPHALAGHDVLGEAPTGSGKTAAFLIPVLEKLWRENWCKADGLGALILTPTRELAVQIFDVLTHFKAHDLSAMAVYGRKILAREQTRIGGINILIGTPGRVKQHLHETSDLNVDNLLIVVLDEADKLIERGFKADVEEILAALPPKEARQNLMFSATLSASVRTLAKSFCRKDQVCSLSQRGAQDGASTSETPTNLTQTYCILRLEDKVNVLYAFLCKNFKHKNLVFVSSIKQARFLYETFKVLKTGAKILEMHGGQDQNKRQNIFDEFKARRAAITLIATDVVGRGIDFPAVDWVIQMDCPPDVETYTHRVGRTARGVEGKGLAVLFLLPSENEFVNRLQEKQIPISHVKMRASERQNISGKLRGLCARHEEIAHLASKAFSTYLKSISLMADKRIFKIKEVLKTADAYAASLGLFKTPTHDIASSAQTREETIDDKADDSTMAGSDAEITGGVLGDEVAKSRKNQTSLERLQEKLKAGQAGEDDEPKLSRREKRQQKIRAMREKAKLTQHTVGDDQSVLITVRDASLEEEDEKKPEEDAKLDGEDWRDSSVVQKALRKQRLVIRSDGTAKLKGAAKLIPSQRIIFDDEKGVGNDVSTFQGVVASMPKPQESDLEDDAEIRAAPTERDRHLLRIQKRLREAKEAEKAEARLRRKAARRKSREAEDAINSDGEEASPSKKSKVEPESLEDLEAAALQKLGLV